jgi:hypothetical protein
MTAALPRCQETRFGKDRPRRRLASGFQGDLTVVIAALRLVGNRAVDLQFHATSRTQGDLAKAESENESYSWP